MHPTLNPAYFGGEGGAMFWLIWGPLHFDPISLRPERYVLFRLKPPYPRRSEAEISRALFLHVEVDIDPGSRPVWQKLEIAFC